MFIAAGQHSEEYSSYCCAGLNSRARVELAQKRDLIGKSSFGAPDEFLIRGESVE